MFETIYPADVITRHDNWNEKNQQNVFMTHESTPDAMSSLTAAILITVDSQVYFQIYHLKPGFYTNSLFIL